MLGFRRPALNRWTRLLDRLGLLSVLPLTEGRGGEVSSWRMMGVGGGGRDCPTGFPARRVACNSTSSGLGRVSRSVGTHLDVPDRLSSSQSVPVLTTPGDRAYTLLGRREALAVSHRREPARPKVLPCLVVPINTSSVAYQRARRREDAPDSVNLNQLLSLPIRRCTREPHRNGAVTRSPTECSSRECSSAVGTLSRLGSLNVHRRERRLGSSRQG